MQKANTTPYVKFLIRLGLVFFALFAVLRVAFWFAFNDTAAAYTFQELSKAFRLGLRFDLRLALTILLPVVLLGWIPVLRPVRKRGGKIWFVYAMVVAGLVTLLYGLDFGYYAYLNGRVNATVLKFIENPLISAEMMWQTYPMVPIALGMIMALAAWALILKRVVFSVVRDDSSNDANVSAAEPCQRSGRSDRKWDRVQLAGLTLILLVGLWGSLAQYPLRWSQAFFGTNNFISALALNPVLYFVDTFTNRERDYERELVSRYYDRIARYLGVESPDAAALNFKRVRAGVQPSIVKDAAARPPNIVYVIMESFAAYKTGAFGHPSDPTPYFDKAAREGTLFTRFYVPSEATARSIFGLLTGIPDIGLTRTSSRNPLVVEQQSVVSAFKNYDKYYFIGGSANWGNIRGVISHNIPGVHLIEEGQFQSPRTDVWGISDLALFEEASLQLAHAKKPYFAFIQTAGFHRPYTIPQERGDFTELTLSKEELRLGGFDSNEEFNSIRFSDYALGRFLERAKDNPAFKNTIFIVHGDHGLPGNAAAHLSEGDRAHGLSRFHVPLLIYSPDLMPKPARIGTVASELDVLPTAAGLAGLPYYNTTLGRNLFDQRYDSDRYAFLYVYYQSPPQIGVIGDRFYSYGIPGQMKGLFEYESDHPTVDVSSEYPEVAKDLEDLTNGLYQTAKYILYNNRHLRPSVPTHDEIEALSARMSVLKAGAR